MGKIGTWMKLRNSWGDFSSWNRWDGNKDSSVQFSDTMRWKNHEEKEGTWFAFMVSIYRRADEGIKNQALNEEKIWRKANMFFTMLSTRMTGILWCTVVAMLWFVNKYVLSSWNPGIFIPQNLMLMYSVHHISILRCLHLLVRMEKNIDNIDWMHGRKRLLENRDTGPWHVSFKIYTGLLFFPEHASLDNSQHNSGYCYMGVSINGGTF